jgi:hypothetical protein
MTLDFFTILFLFTIIVQIFFKKQPCNDEKCPVHWYLPAYKITPLPHSQAFNFMEITCIKHVYFLHYYKLTSQSSDDELHKSSCFMFGSML